MNNKLNEYIIDKWISYDLVIKDLEYWNGENEKSIYNVIIVVLYEISWIQCRIKRKTVIFESIYGGFSARNRINYDNDEYFRDLWTSHGRVCNVSIYNLAHRMRDINPYSGALFNNMA